MYELIKVSDNLIERKNDIPVDDRIIEKSYALKARIYIKLSDIPASNKIYESYADELIKLAQNIVRHSTNETENIENREWFMAENNIKNAIELYQNHGAPEKANEAQRLLVEVQKECIKNLQMHEFKTDVTKFHEKFVKDYQDHDIHRLIIDLINSVGFQNKSKIKENIINGPTSFSSLFSTQILGNDGQTEYVLPGLDIKDEENILMHMFYKAKQMEEAIGRTFVSWFIQDFMCKGLKESDLDFIFKGNQIIPSGQEDDVQRGIYLGLTGNLSDALDKLAPKAENIIRNVAEMCGDLMTYYDVKLGINQKKVLSQVFEGKNLNLCVEENILFTFNGLLQQKAGSNIRNRVGHGLMLKEECYSGDCIYFVAIMLKYCALYSKECFEELIKYKTESNII